MVMHRRWQRLNRQATQQAGGAKTSKEDWTDSEGELALSPVVTANVRASSSRPSDAVRSASHTEHARPQPDMGRGGRGTSLHAVQNVVIPRCVRASATGLALALVCTRPRTRIHSLACERWPSRSKGAPCDGHAWSHAGSGIRIYACLIRQHEVSDRDNCESSLVTMRPAAADTLARAHR